jgi:Fe-S-cluster containining protein
LDDPSGRFEFNKVPCPFLADNQCTNYAYRPENCRSYPHLHKKDFVSRLFGVIDNYEICPIVFHVVEQLKIELGFHDWDFEEDFNWL